MPTLTKQQVADQLNRLQTQGATDAQLASAVAAAGYTESDFNVDLNGTFRPMVAGTGTVTQNYTAAELAESNQYYQSLASSSSVAVNQKITTSTTVYQQSTGGGTTTVTNLPPTDTALSLSYSQGAKQALSLQQAYQLNPDSKFGRSALDRQLANGTISQEQYNEIVNSTPEQRTAKSLEYSSQYQTLSQQASDAQVQTPPTVTTTVNPNTSTITVESRNVLTEPDSVAPTPEIAQQQALVAENNGETPAAVDTALTTPDTVSGPSGTPYDDDGNLNVGWGLNEEGNPVWVGAGYVDATGETFQSSPESVSGPTGTPYDDDGNLNPGWGIDENGNPVWIEAGYIDATGETIQAQKTVSGPTGTPYDDDGNLNPGWTLDEENNPVWVGGDFVEPATQASADASREAATNARGTSATTNAQSQATQQDVNNFYQTGDWRVRLSLAPGANYLYKASDPGILLPLNATNGVIFPYTPSISVVYAAQYDPFDLVHSNYKSYNYKSSSVDQISITCEFTAQDTFEANYLLAVIHFFRSVTKMFYGQDEKPDLGTPPPLCYLSGLGAFQFDKHPLAITSFNYSLPTDVDYIRATHTTTSGGVNKSPSNEGITPTIAQIRGAPTGGNTGSPKWQVNTGGSVTPTYVPTKMQIQISAVPIVSRNDISRAFSLRKYATGELLRGSKRNGGGIW